MRRVDRTNSETLTTDLLACLAGDRRCAVAVSGGGDSMALLHLIAEIHDRLERVLALTVDHGLRSESGREAAFVASICAEQGIRHETLRWKPEPGESGNLSLRAREARYALMTEACRVQDIPLLLTAHTLDDQAETVLMRLARGSGVDGLAAIPREIRMHGLAVRRPLLGQRRAVLRAYLESMGAVWCEDPTNEDDGYDRIKARRLLSEASELGLSPERLAATATVMGEARVVLDRAADALQSAICVHAPPGHVFVERTGLLSAPKETAWRLLSRLLCRVSGQGYRPRLSSLQDIFEAPAAGDRTVRTLHGCLIDTGPTRLTLSREPARCVAPVALKFPETVWDNRFRLRIASAQAAPQGTLLGAAGEAGLRAIAACGKNGHTPPKHWTLAPRSAKLAAPALWRDGEPVAIPHADWYLHAEEARYVVEPIAREFSVPVDPAGSKII